MVKTFFSIGVMIVIGIISSLLSETLYVCGILIVLCAFIVKRILMLITQKVTNMVIYINLKLKNI